MKCFDPKGASTSKQLHYEQVSRIVNKGGVPQVGIVLANELFEIVLLISFNSTYCLIRPPEIQTTIKVDQ